MLRNLGFTYTHKDKILFRNSVLSDCYLPEKYSYTVMFLNKMQYGSIF